MAISDFPNLQSGVYDITSPVSVEYNCIAWAAGSNDLWWWPDLQDSYWPDGVTREETLEAFIQAYGTLGFTECADGSLEAGIEKIALYATPDNEPTHAALQQPSGRWTSKLGPDE